MLFEEFPQFMQGVARVVQQDNRHLHWVVNIAGVDRKFDAEITNQTPDEVIEWRAGDETVHHGTDHLPDDRRRDHVAVHALRAQPSGFAEKAGDALGVVDKRVEGDRVVKAS